MLSEPMPENRVIGQIFQNGDFHHIDNSIIPLLPHGFDHIAVLPYAVRLGIFPKQCSQRNIDQFSYKRMQENLFILCEMLCTDVRTIREFFGK